MQITRSSLDTVKGPADWFTGDVYIDPVAPGPPRPGSPPPWCTSCPERAPTGTTTRSARPSSSPRGSACASAGAGPSRSSGQGDRVLFEADEEHWHGAAPNRLMVHVAINEGDADHDVVHWLTPVTDEEYAAAPSPH